MRFGLVEYYDSKKTHYHLEENTSDESLINERGQLWKRVMEKYGYKCRASYAR